jgi:hypothetical protein
MRRILSHSKSGSLPLPTLGRSGRLGLRGLVCAPARCQGSGRSRGQSATLQSPANGTRENAHETVEAAECETALGHQGSLEVRKLHRLLGGHRPLTLGRTLGLGW